MRKKIRNSIKYFRFINYNLIFLRNNFVFVFGNSGPKMRPKFLRFKAFFFCKLFMTPRTFFLVSRLIRRLNLIMYILGYVLLNATSLETIFKYLCIFVTVLVKVVLPCKKYCTFSRFFFFFKSNRISLSIFDCISNC